MRMFPATLAQSHYYAKIDLQQMQENINDIFVGE